MDDDPTGPEIIGLIQGIQKMIDAVNQNRADWCVLPILVRGGEDFFDCRIVAADTTRHIEGEIERRVERAMGLPLTCSRDRHLTLD